MITSCYRLVVIGVFCSVTFASKTFSQAVRKATLHFANDEYELTDQQKQYLDSVSYYLRNIPDAYRFTVAGHTDSVGSNGYNKNLSFKRAAAVADFLIGKGFKPSQMQLQAKGFSAPVAANDNEENKELNRRVEIQFQLSLPRVRSIAGISNPIERLSISTEGGTIVTATGTKIAIPPDAFVDAAGNPIKGKVDVKYIEYRDAVDFLLSEIPMHFNTPGGVIPFNSAGMFTITASQANTDVYLKTGKKIDVGFKYNASVRDLNFYRFDTITQSWKTMAPIKPVVNRSFGECMNSFDLRSVPLCQREADFKKVYMVTTGLRFTEPDDSSLYSFAQKRKLQALQVKASEAEQLYIKKAKQLLRRFALETEKKGAFGKERIKIYQVRGKNDISSKMLEEVYFNMPKTQAIADILPQSGFDDINLEYTPDSGVSVTFINGKKTGRVSNVVLKPEHNASSFNIEQWLANFNYHCKVYKELAGLYRDTAAMFAKQVKTHQNAIDDLYFDTWLLNYDSLSCFQKLHEPFMSEDEKRLSFDAWLLYYNSHKGDMKKLYMAEKAKEGYADMESNVRARKNIELYYTVDGTARMRYTTADLSVSANFSIPSLGTYNCDQLQRLEDPVNMYVKYKNSKGEDVKPVIAYLIDSKLNGLLRFDGNYGMSPYKIAFSPKSTTRMVLVDKAGESYLVKPEEFANVDKSRTNVEYTLIANAITKAKNKEELKFILRM